MRGRLFERESQPDDLNRIKIWRNHELIKSVIFDYGLVLCRAPETHVIERLCQLFGVDHSTFWILYERNRGAYDRGDLSAEEYWSEFSRETGKKLTNEQVEWLRTYDMEMWSQLRPEMFAWVEELRKAGYKTSILSNMNKDFAAHLRKNAEWIKQFDSHVFSAELREIKPSPKIFRHCLQVMDCTPSDALFIDDREANILAARKEGITSVLFESANQLRAELASMGWKVLPPDQGAPVARAM